MEKGKGGFNLPHHQSAVTKRGGKGKGVENPSAVKEMKEKETGFRK